MNPEPRELAEYKSDHDILIELKTEMRLLREDLKSREAAYVTQAEFLPVKNDHVSQAEFWPIKMLVYGCTGIMLSSLIVAIIYLVIQH